MLWMLVEEGVATDALKHWWKGSEMLADSAIPPIHQQLPYIRHL